MSKLLRVEDLTKEEKANLMRRIYGEWTTKPPTQEGWYWAFYPERDVDLVRVFLADHGSHKTLEVWVDQYESDALSDFSHWLGPIPQPEAPE